MVCGGGSVAGLPKCTCHSDNPSFLFYPSWVSFIGASAFRTKLHSDCPRDCIAVLRHKQSTVQHSSFLNLRDAPFYTLCAKEYLGWALRPPKYFKAPPLLLLLLLLLRTYQESKTTRPLLEQVGTRSRQGLAYDLHCSRTSETSETRKKTKSGLIEHSFGGSGHPNLLRQS